jgi:hypothetical protein
MAQTTITIEPSKALEDMFRRLASEAAAPFADRGTKAEAELAELKAKIKALGERLNVVPVPGGPIGDRQGAMLDEITRELLDLGR